MKDLTTELLKAQATLKNLHWCIDNQMEDLDITSSLDVLEDQLAGIIDLVDQRKEGVVNE